MVNVFLTIDTEVYPLTADWREKRLQADIDRDIYGITPDGEFGLRYQLRVLREHGLKAVFFVEPLFASVPEIGPGPLREIVRLIVDDGHDVQLHVHPEWLDHIPDFGVASGTGLIKDFSADVQYEILSSALANLRDALAGSGAEDRIKVCAFRAGDFAADGATLRAVGRTGLMYDSSYNVGYGRLGTGRLMFQPQFIEDICEVPVSFFEDWPGHFRPMQLGAASYAESVRALERAEDAGWAAFVIVSHSFELLRNRWRAGRPIELRQCVRSRFERLCGYLNESRGRFRTATFSEFAAPAMLTAGVGRPIKGNALATAWRVLEQLSERLR